VRRHGVLSALRLTYPALIVTAALLLAAGVLVYLLDRPAGSAWLIPREWHAGPAPSALRSVFGSVGAWLPSFVHAFAFSVFTAAVLPRRLKHAAAASVGWAALDTLAEFGQHPALAGPIAAALEHLFGAAPWALQVGRYFTRGSFSLADVAAGICGAALAYLGLRYALRLTLRSDHQEPISRS
jgi:hypothetical protein